MSDDDLITVPDALETPDSWDLDGQLVFITGAASGIGAATARLAAANGADVIVADLGSSAGRAVADEIGGSFLELDVTSDESWAAAASALETVDIAMLNAGVEFRDVQSLNSSPDDPAEWDLAKYRRANAVNIDGVVLGVHTLAPLLERRGGGAINVTASLAGLIPWSPDPIYSMTKWAVIGFVRAIAPPLKLKNIRINAVCPGGVATPMTGFHDGEVPNGMADPGHIATAQLAIATSGRTGRAIKAVAGYAHAPHAFAEVTNTY